MERSSSQASLSRHRNNAVQIHVKKRTHCPLQLILIAFEGLRVPLQLSNGFRLRTLFMIMPTMKKDVTLFCFQGYQAARFWKPQKQPAYFFLLSVRCGQMQLCAGWTCVTYNFLPPRIIINMFLGPVHRQFCRRSPSFIIIQGHTGQLPKQSIRWPCSLLRYSRPYFEGQGKKNICPLLMEINTAKNMAWLKGKEDVERMAVLSWCFTLLKMVFPGYELAISTFPLNSFYLKQILNKKWDLGELYRFLLSLQRYRDFERLESSRPPTPPLPAWTGLCRWGHSG